MRWHRIARRFGEAAISYVVTTTSKDVKSARSSDLISSRSRFSPEWSRTTRSDGTKRLNSLTHEPSTDNGATTSDGPVIPHSNLRKPRNAITWNVLPRPISSARMPLMPWRSRARSPPPRPRAGCQRAPCRQRRAVAPASTATLPATRRAVPRPPASDPPARPTGRPPAHSALRAAACSPAARRLPLCARSHLRAVAKLPPCSAARLLRPLAPHSLAQRPCFPAAPSHPLPPSTTCACQPHPPPSLHPDPFPPLCGFAARVSLSRCPHRSARPRSPLAQHLARAKAPLPEPPATSASLP
eukprot:5331643-Pleurochrysis_carterae.AAC.2